ncbi:hypothetical protein EOW58_22855, partial [Salmonella enterica]|nr:hypothetical protein [Salmonella enterica]
KIQFLVQDIQNTRPGKSKRDKITSLIEYVELLNEDVKNIRENLKHPYLNENKIIHALLEIQIQTRLMQIGEAKSFHELAVYLFNIRMLIDNAINQPRTLYRVILNQ